MIWYSCDYDVPMLKQNFIIVKINGDRVKRVDEIGILR